jgi:hypothetical protein
MLNFDADASVLRTALIAERNLSQKWAEMYGNYRHHPNHQMYMQRVRDLDRMIDELWVTKGKVTISQTEEQAAFQPPTPERIAPNDDHQNTIVKFETP